ncbi:MAG: HAMP domain-containing histidine kinase [Sporolactobacillus sp.]|nr:HAMP domain-containing histidine kinase [Sporolactobacillus sp.]
MKKRSIDSGRKRRTTLAQMTFWYILILSLTTLFIGVAAISFVSYQLYRETRQEIHYVEKQLRVESKEHQPDWTDSIENILYEQHPDFYVHIETPMKRTIYSKGSENITDDTAYPIKLSSFSSIVFKKPLVPVYHHRFTYNGYTFDLFIRMIQIHRFIVVITRAMAVAMFFGILIGALAIYQLARKLSRPLMEVTAKIDRAIKTNDLKLHVPVPDQPKEVNDLARSFNQLMDQLKRQIEREHQFVSDASHELRTPLAAIRGHVELIQRHGNGHPEVVERSMHFIDQESRRMQRLIDQLLMTARIEHRSQALEPVDLSVIARNVIDDYATELTQKLSTDIADHAYAWANEDYIHQAIVSLLGNAGKYAPADGMIGISVTMEKPSVYLRVWNSGPSIPDSDKEKIFTRFYRGDPSRSSQKNGTGLGLAIVRKLVALQKGEIWVEDGKPSGSVFIIRLAAVEAKN